MYICTLLCNHRLDFSWGFDPLHRMYCRMPNTYFWNYNSKYLIHTDNSLNKQIFIFINYKYYLSYEETRGSVVTLDSIIRYLRNYHDGPDSKRNWINLFVWSLGRFVGCYILKSCGIVLIICHLLPIQRIEGAIGDQSLSGTSVIENVSA